ncbi:MAG: phosphate acetyltransferase [Victivallales bacterium]|nr:phosphate acetyltransferase [Victivallales bacterium]
MPILDQIVSRVRSSGRTIVLPEGHDPRVVAAAERIVRENIAKVIVIGTEGEIAESCKAAGVLSRNFSPLDHLASDLVEEFAGEFCEIRKKKNMTMDRARMFMENRIFFGAMMVRRDLAHGLVAGSIASTADMLRAAFSVVGTAEGIATGSSCFVMDLACPTPAGDNTILYADCGVNSNPDAAQLSDIAVATAASCRSLLGVQPRIAFLSFSTKGSAQNLLLEKIVEACEMTKKRIADSGCDIVVDGELQADAAITPAVAEKKCPGSPVAGRANVLIFPDLNSGNICYKITERLAGAKAYGPILQGLKKPLNDLSRGCTADDIFGVAAITVCQSME